MSGSKKKLLIAVVAIVLVAAAAVAFFLWRGRETDKPVENKGSITVFNWYDYIDEDKLSAFTESTGIDVKYVCFTTVEEMYAKLTAGGGSYDVIFPSDYIIERLIKENGLVALDKSLIPNAAGIMDWLQSPAYDPDNTYSLPYMWGTVGILYNTNLVNEEITSWTSMFDPKYQGQVFMLDSYRDTLGMTLVMLGYDLNTHDQAELNAAKDKLIQQKADGIVKGYLVDETKDKMIGGEAAMALMWSGDAQYAISENEGDNLRYVVPSEGSNVWVDAMCIPTGSTNVPGAHAFMDFLCQEDIARANFEYIYYCTPIQSVFEGMSDEEKAYPALNPSQETIENCEFFHDVADYVDMYEDIWVEIRN